MPTQAQKQLMTMTVNAFVSSVFVDPSRNIRDFYNVNPLAEQIFTAGEVWEPLEIYKAVKSDDTDLPYALGPDGNRRAAALHLLHEQGRAGDIADVPCVLLPSKPDEMGYLIRQLQTGNVTESKLALTAAEEGLGYKRMRALDPSLTNAIIAKRIGVSEQYIKGRQQLADAPSELHDLCPYVGNKIAETLARTYNPNKGEVTRKNLIFLCGKVKEHVKPGEDEPISKEAMELCREVTGARGKAKKDAAVTLVAKAAPKKGKVVFTEAERKAQGPDNKRSKSPDDLPKTAKQTLAALWNNYEALIKDMPADSPLLVAFKDAKVKTLNNKEAVLRNMLEQTPEAKALTLYAGMPVLLQAFGIEAKHPLTVARSIAHAIAKENKDD